VEIRPGGGVKSFALALGAGGARGLAHIAVFEALDELALRPVAIAGSSIGALAGALYAGGMSGKAIRSYTIDLAHRPGEMWRRLMLARAGTIGDLFGGDFSSAMRLDAEKLVTQFLPASLADSFDELAIPLVVVASDLYARGEVAFAAGPLRPALAASIALPTIVRPVVIDGRVLVDGGATNPLPFDLLRGRADALVAVDVSGPPDEAQAGIPNTIDALNATVTVMTTTIINEKLRHAAPDLLLRPAVGSFRTLDFLRASAIVRVAEPLKSEFKAALEALLQGKRQRQ
jgi:NTE family protein